MANLRRYLRQSVSVRRREGTSEWGTPSYGDEEDFPARKEIVQRRIRNSEGTEVMASTKVMMLEELQVDDEIDGVSVQDRENVVDLRGRVLGWVYYL